MRGHRDSNPKMATTCHDGIFPDRWGEGVIVPLHRKGSMLNPTNYRGVTLLNVLGKIFTRILNNSLDGWAEKYQIYIEA